MVFTGGAKAEYDGSQQVTVKIPTGQPGYSSYYGSEEPIGSSNIGHVYIMYNANELYLSLYTYFPVAARDYTITVNLPGVPKFFKGTSAVVADDNICKVVGGCLFNTTKDSKTATIKLHIDASSKIRANMHLLYNVEDY